VRNLGSWPYVFGGVKDFLINLSFSPHQSTTRLILTVVAEWAFFINQLAIFV